MDKRRYNSIHTDHLKSEFYPPLLKFLLNQSKEILVVLDSDLKVILLNPIAENLFNCSAKTIIGLPFSTVCTQAKFDYFLKKYTDKILSKPITPNIHATLGDKNLTWTAFQIDVGERSLLVLSTPGFEEEERQDDIVRLETLIENMPCNVYWMDKNCLMLGCNQNVLSMLNMSREQYIGKTYEELAEIGRWPEGLAEKLKNDDLEVLRSGQPIFGVEDPPIPHANNTFLHLLTSRVPLRNNSGEIIGVAGISVDISELKAAREAAEAANNSKTEFIANMSHDIRTPLTGVVGMSKLLEDKAHDQEERQYARWINESGQQLLALLNGVLDVVAADHVSENDIQEETFDPRQSIQEIAHLEFPTIKMKNLDLKIEIDPTVPQYICTDRSKLHRILLNLLGNAIKFTEKGSVTVKVEHLANLNEKVQLKFDIIDTGIGIPDNLQGKVFDRFFRGNPSYKGVHQGHGVGLHIAKKYVELLGGKLQLLSTFGKGTCFFFTLTLKIGSSKGIKSQDNTRLEIAETSPVNPPNLELGKSMTTNLPHILLVEDNIVALQLAETIAIQAGCSVTSATSGEHALELVKATDFDLIITDVGLPGISGNELAQSIRSWEKSSHKNHMPIIGLTALTVDQIEQECLQSGMNKVLSKPVYAKTLQELVQEYILPSKIASNTKTESPLGHDLPDAEEQLFELNKFPLLDISQGVTNVGDEKILKELLQLMVDKAIPEDELYIQKAYAEKNWKKVEDLAHKMKAGALYCGTIRMQYACLYLERYRKAGHSDLLEKLYYQLIQVLDETQQYIEKWLRDTKK